MQTVMADLILSESICVSCHIPLLCLVLPRSQSFQNMKEQVGSSGNTYDLYLMFTV
jgi:hypothetical protein